MELVFLGAAGTVTGSKFLVRTKKLQILVDCGMFQGLKEFRLMNWEPLPIKPANIDAVVLTHAHLDHSGYLPRLIKQGFKGPIFATAATVEVTKIVLEDAAKIQEEEANFANKHGYSKHKPALPLYDSADVEKTLPQFIGLDLQSDFEFEDVIFRFEKAGHILGAASVLIKNEGSRVLFSGDIGRPNDPLMPVPEAPVLSDAIVMESTYGDRVHKNESTSELLRDLVLEAFNKKSILLIPAFAIGRAQNLMYELVTLRKNREIPKEIPIYLNTPMGQKITALYKQHSDSLKISADEMQSILEEINFVETSQDSKALNERQGPMVIIAASGMLTGGRVLYHLESFGGDPKNIILLAGFQGAGTRGWALANGCTELKVHGQYIPIKAKVVQSDAFSAHADQKELLAWLAQAAQKPQQVFLVHGEPSASAELANRIRDHLGIPVTVPKLNQTILLKGIKPSTHD
ncbi:MBL fold metallo-hydrolase RNA specificity domain-containing protein [Bdellovibrio sp. HCB2-146]|uniref:MBL fold metallo-hydrolase RNA specificity domain-containing protein n=1 Tax=Bdellovibrio sp. HCB2-146 TaxID=3394362 RepID=UPI0039BCDEA5